MPADDAMSLGEEAALNKLEKQAEAILLILDGAGKADQKELFANLSVAGKGLQSLLKRKGKTAEDLTEGALLGYVKTILARLVEHDPVPDFKPAAAWCLKILEMRESNNLKNSVLDVQAALVFLKERKSVQGRADAAIFKKALEAGAGGYEIPENLQDWLNSTRSLYYFDEKIVDAHRSTQEAAGWGESKSADAH